MNRTLEAHRTWFASLIAIAVASSASPRAHAYCPSYTPQQTAANSKCAIAPAAGNNPGIMQLNGYFASAALGKAGWGSGGPDIGTINQGCNKPNNPVPVQARFPCVLIKALVMRESGWRQFCKPDAPAASVGAAERTLVSFDCGYGLGQVTSGMHVGETTTFDRTRVANDALYNIAVGMTILKAKWSATKCVGDNDPDIAEDWYTAIWAYNGLSYANNPNNPKLKAGRGPYNPNVGGAYAYQELIYGWMEFPPSATYWPAVAAAYPNRATVGTAGSPPALPESTCASPTDCTKTRGVHSGACAPLATPDGGAPDAGIDPPPAIDAGFAGPNDPDAGPNMLPDDPSAAGGCCAVAPHEHAPSGLAGVAAIAAAVGALYTRRRGVASTFRCRARPR